MSIDTQKLGVGVKNLQELIDEELIFRKNTMKKSIREWLNELPEPYNEMAISQIRKENYDVNNLQYAIKDGLVLSTTREGAEFWLEVRDWTVDPLNNKLPEIPNKKSEITGTIDLSVLTGLGGIASDHVNHPSHYTDGKIEVIDFIEDKKLNFHLGNAVKYIARAGKKDDYKQDLEKAIWYLKREIEKNYKNKPMDNNNFKTE